MAGQGLRAMRALGPRGAGEASWVEAGTAFFSGVYTEKVRPVGAQHNNLNTNPNTVPSTTANTNPNIAAMKGRSFIDSQKVSLEKYL